MLPRLPQTLSRAVPAFPHARQTRIPPFTFTSPPSSSRHLLRQTVPFPRFRSVFQTRNMSSAPAKKEFLCILPDKPGAQAKRLEVRPLHLEGVKPHVASGTIVAGAMLNAHPADGETPSFKGSMMMVIAENEAQVLELLKNDIYVKSDVWDMEKAQIIPYKSAVREAL